MNKKIVLDKILNYFIKDKNDIPDDLNSKIKLWKEIISTYDLNDVPKDILEVEDMYLRYELLNRKLTDADKIKTVGDTLVKNIKYSDFIALWEGDLTSIYADSIVHLTSLKKLVNDQVNVDKIVLNSGMRLKKKCRDALGDGSLNKSDVLITRSYNLPCDFIIHVVEPDGRSKSYIEDIKNSYKNILVCVKNNIIRSVVIPCIGIDKTDKEEYINIMLDSIYDFLDKYHEIVNTKIIINASNEDLDIIKSKLMEKIEK